MEETAKAKFAHSFSASTREEVRKRVLLDLSASGKNFHEKEEIEKRVETVLLSMGLLLPSSQVETLCCELHDELFGMGPLEPFFKDPEISEIMVNGASKTFIEKRGVIEQANIRFENEAKILELVRRVLAPLNLRLDETSPMVDARLPDGSRLNAIIPPLCLNGPTVTIRRFRVQSFTKKELVELGTFPSEIASFLEKSVIEKANILISGGTSSGKTTLLNVLSSLIPKQERLITIEDAAELRIEHPHVISLESRPPSIEGKGEITVRDLVRNALRMRPDRIIVGEVRGPEALDMLQAMNTGHPGSLSTAHANSPIDLVSRLETMVLTSGVNLNIDAVRRQIASALDLIIHMERLRDGRRVVSEIVRVSQGSDSSVRFDPIFLDAKGRNRNAEDDSSTLRKEKIL
ncbi:MAG: CpaF family protein [Actinomycetota bacterium]|nr:CpaF family protein [Actinomycetota bacterium]